MNFTLTATTTTAKTDLNEGQLFWFGREPKRGKQLRIYIKELRNILKMTGGKMLKH